LHDKIPPKLASSIVKSLVIDGFVQILDENVSVSSSSQAWISLRPHDAERSSFDFMKVEKIKSSFGVMQGVIVHVSVSQRASCNSVSTYTYRSNWSNLFEEFEELSFVDIWVHISFVDSR
jgi:hypothetical protein